MIVQKKVFVHRSLWVLQCPNCDRVLASASEKRYLPPYAYCDCDSKKGGEQ